MCRCCKAAINRPEGDGAGEAARKLDEYGTDRDVSLHIFCEEGMRRRRRLNMNLRVKGWQKIERRGEENRARRWKAKRPNSRASQHPFHQSDSRLNLPLNRGVCVCIELHKSPYACAPFGCVCLEGGGFSC